MKKMSTVEELKGERISSADSSTQLVSGAPARVISSEELLQSETEIGIVHQGAMYRLRVTRGGKLILNK
jgi:hemin uptake protein HemP